MPFNLMRSFNLSRRLMIFALTSTLALLAFWWAHSTPRVIAQGPPVCVPPPSGMVSWWPGDGNANDIQGSNHGTLMNGATFATGRVGQAFSLDGVDDYVTVPNDPSLNPNTMTVMAWYRTTSFAGNGNNAIVQKAYIAHSPPYYQYHLGVAGDQYPHAPGANFSFGVAAGGVIDGVATPPGFWSPGQWYHLVGTYDGTAIKLYVDGALIGSRAASGAVADYGRPLLIGGFANFVAPASLDFTPGMIDEVAIFDRALSASEIQAIFNAGSTGKCRACSPPPSGMVSWLPGDGNANDIQGSNDGTLQNGATFAAGKVGQALSFDGVNDYVEVPDSPSLTPSSITLDAWVYPNSLSGGRVIVSKYDSSNPSINGVSWILAAIEGTGRLRFAVYQDAPGSIVRYIDTNTPALTVGVWQHVAATFDLVTQAIRIYVNGVESPSTLGAGSTTITSIYDSNTPVRLGTGVDYQGNLVGFWNGLIDEVEIFNRALTASEIQAIVNAGSAGKCKTPANRPPVAMCQNVTVSAGASCTAANASIDAGSSDPDGDTLTLTQSPPGPYSLGTTNVMLTVTDGKGGSNTCNATVTVKDTQAPSLTLPPNINVVDNAAGMCGAVVSYTATATDNCGTVTVTCTPASGSTFPVGTTTVNCTASDASPDSPHTTGSFTVTVTNPAPMVTITGPVSGALYVVGSTVNFTGTFTDNAGDNHTGVWMFDAISNPATITEASGAGSANASYMLNAAGVYTVTLTVTDDCGQATTATTVGGLSAMIVVYDPSGGFVTGGGWINSPAGACPTFCGPDPNLTGKANFGFVSKYHNGATIPSGNTEFQFKAGNLNFKSTVYEWLVIAGARAQYKGSGKINNAGDYRFMLTAIDGQVNGGGGQDKFRIRIWNNAGGGLVYDNQLNAPDSADPTTLLGGGSIVIHK